LSHCCATLGGEKFNAVAASFTPVNKTSLQDAGRHGASNTWANWNTRTTQNRGIASRAPYGPPKAKKSRVNLQLGTLGGTSNHHKGLGIGAHGHGIGVIPANIGGAHGVTRTPVKVAPPTKSTRGTGVQQHLPAQSGPAVVSSGSFCPKCFGTWLAIGALVFAGLILSGR
jgi:hypothetical protein